MQKKIKFMNYLLILSFVLFTEVRTDNSIDLECVSVPDRTFVRNPLSCRDYFLCSPNKIKSKGSCPEPLLFNDLTQSCDPPQVVNCNSCKTDMGLQYFIDARNCSNFYKCVDNVRKHYRCPENMYFDYGSSSCLDKSFVTCETEVDTGFGDEAQSNDPWAVPGAGTNRPSPQWGPPRPPPGNGASIFPPAGGGVPPYFPPPTPPPSRPPGGIGTWTVAGTPVRPTRPPWGAPDAPPNTGGY